MKKLIIFLLFSSLQARYGFTPETFISKSLTKASYLKNIKYTSKILGFSWSYAKTYVNVLTVVPYTACKAVYITLANDEIIVCGSRQLFYCTHCRQWLRAHYVTSRNNLLAYSNQSIPVKSVTIVRQPTHLIALECSLPNTYIVGRSQIITHH